MIRLLNIPTVILATLLVFSQISQTSVQGQGLFREPKVIPVGQQSARPSTSQTADEVASQVQDFVPQATPETRLRPIAPREGFPTNDRPSGDLSNLGSSVLVPSPNERQNSFRPSIPGDGGEMRPIIPGRTDLRSMIEGSFQDEDTESDIQGPETITQRYPNGKPQLIKQVAQDAEGNYYDHGEWKVLNLQGDTLAKGQFYEGVMDGLWMRYHPQGSGGIFAAKPFNLFKAPFYSTASFSKGELDGVWLLQDAFERKVFEIPYRKGIRHGTAKWWFPNAVVMREVNFKEGLIDGPLREWNDENKLVRYEEFIDGKRIIRQTTFYRPKQRQDENFFLDGKLELSGSDDWWKAQPASFEVTTPRIQHGPALAWYENDQPKMLFCCPYTTLFLASWLLTANPSNIESQYEEHALNKRLDNDVLARVPLSGARPRPSLICVMNFHFFEVSTPSQIRS